ncbi:DNA polymerase III subunit beta [Legionella sp. W05-934-2]|uniref:DNA polymerase III subunit beta n=1 Tax=Legionella sp. W05-934-2 TaxID=1198649 RepID=UPI0034625637
MFQFSIDKAALQLPLLTVAGAVDRKQSMPILSNILLTLNHEELILSATDLEIDVTARLKVDNANGTGQTTVPAKKFVDIIRSLDDDAKPLIVVEEKQLVIRDKHSHFKLATLPADGFPISEQPQNLVELSLSKARLTHLLQSTYFSMSQQDVRVFLNGMLLSFDAQGTTAVATDGHRLAICHTDETRVEIPHRIIVPRKAVLELLRLLSAIEDEKVDISAGESHFCLKTKIFSFNTKLVESRYPPYQKAIPKQLNTFVLLDRDSLKKALNRITILAHEKTKAIVVSVQSGQLQLTANNQQQEEAKEIVSAEVDGQPIQLGLNAAYLLDVINHCQDGLIRLSFVDENSSLLFESLADEAYQYIIMPMKL